MKSGVHAGLSSRRSRVQIPSLPPHHTPGHQSGREVQGQVAQLVERWSEKPEVDGSTPSLTTTEIPCTAGDFVILENPPGRPEARPGRAEGAIFPSGSFQ